MHSHNTAVFKPTLHLSALAKKTKPCTAVDAMWDLWLINSPKIDRQNK